MIYPIRPYGCAALFSIHPPASCNPRFGDPGNQRTVTSGDIDNSFWFGRLDQFMVTNVPFLVFEILQGGIFTLSKIPGLERLDTEFFKEPAERWVLRSFPVRSQA